MTIVLAKRQFPSGLAQNAISDTDINPWHCARGASLLRLQFRHGVLAGRVSGIRIWLGD